MSYNEIMNKKDLKKYIGEYMNSWSANNPDELLKFYSKNVQFVDPANPKGIENKKDLELYLKPLLRRNSKWNWAIQELIPSKKGCIVKSKAIIPVGRRKEVVSCVDIIELRGKKITRNEIFFDTPKGYKVK